MDLTAVVLRETRIVMKVASLQECEDENVCSWRPFPWKPSLRIGKRFCERRWRSVEVREPGDERWSEPMQVVASARDLVEKWRAVADPSLFRHVCV
jgi:hypothetical protein